MVFLRNISVETLHKGDTKDNNNNNNNNKEFNIYCNKSNDKTKTDNFAVICKWDIWQR
jgi:hypothetical protein